VYSVVEIGGHQYKVQPGDLIDVQKLSDEEGKTVKFDKVLFVGGESTAVGTPLVSGATVKAKVIRQARDRKLIVYKWKRRSGRRVKNGHRQHYTGLLVTEISDGNKTVKMDAKHKNAKLLK